MALARLLQACAEASESMLGVLCRAVSELQHSMDPLMTLNRDDVTEASLLRPVEEESDLPPPGRGDHPPGWGDWSSGVPGPALQHTKNLRFVEPA